MTKDQLKKTLEGVAETAEKLFKKEGSIAPVLFVYYTFENKEGKDVDSCDIFSILQMEHREAILFMLGKTFLKNNKFKRVNAIVLASEAWMSVQDTKEGPLKNLLPSHDPDRKEILNITGMTDTRESAMLVFDIKNKNDAEKRKLEKNEKASNMSKIENRLLDRFWQGMGMVVGRNI